MLAPHKVAKLAYYQHAPGLQSCLWQIQLDEEGKEETLRPLRESEHRYKCRGVAAWDRRLFWTGGVEKHRLEGGGSLSLEA